MAAGGPTCFVRAMRVMAAGFTDMSTIVVYFGNDNQMAMAKPRDAGRILVGGLDHEFW